MVASSRSLGPLPPPKIVTGEPRSRPPTPPFFDFATFSLVVGLPRPTACSPTVRVHVLGRTDLGLPWEPRSCLHSFLPCSRLEAITASGESKLSLGLGSARRDPASSPRAHDELELTVIRA
ncbi:hypothetical protein NL676_030706 [Syzygium grande]|nr:hypothetical protein NL676_030706 [Syzygium grande]